MSLKVIELNDNAIRVGDENGIILQSPGFALAVGNELELGESAQQKARIHPTSSYNKYWHELSMEPLSHGNGIRHLADIAYAHLLYLSKTADVDADVIFAVPGNFTRQQLAILLGLAKQSPFNPVGIVDSALVAALSIGHDGPALVYVDIQLHQVVLTKVLTNLTTSNKQFEIDSVVQVPGVGSQNFMDLMMRLATGLFIQQCRFNPQHDAESEQQLYNALPHWLRQNDANESSLLLELKTPDAVHTAKMPRASLIDNLSGYYKNIRQQITALSADKDTQLLVSGDMAALPGFITSLHSHNNIQILDPYAISATCLDYRAHISSNDSELHLVTSLALIGDDKSLETDSKEPTILQAQELPTHILFRNRAIAIDNIEIRNNQKPGSDQLNAEESNAQLIVLSQADLPASLGRFEKQNKEIYVDTGDQEFLLNQARVRGRQKLSLGDSIQFGNNSEEIRLIQVHNGQ